MNLLRLHLSDTREEWVVAADGVLLGHVTGRLQRSGGWLWDAHDNHGNGLGVYQTRSHAVAAVEVNRQRILVGIADALQTVQI